MSKKRNIIIIGIIQILLIIFSLICIFIPSITIDIKGEKYQTLNIGEQYIENGASAYINLLFNKKELDIHIIGNVDTDKIGKYTVSYKVKNKYLEKEIVRIIKVTDTEKPKLILNDEVKVCKKNNLIEINATATDNYDGDLSDKIKYEINNEKIHISVIDESNNITEIVENIKYIDSEKPKISLNGKELIYLNKGDKYEEQGAKAYDSCDGDITQNIKIEGNVDTSSIGSYKISYKTSDSMGNETKIYRTIIINEIKEEMLQPVNNATIYLTFDDGPGLYTNDILNILEKYDVKATFFVTNQFPSYKHLIKTINDKGHSIGIHTYSHKWSIYKSVETYLDDYKKMEEIVYNEIGYKPKIFRFPGGSSNTVSKNYSKGIMSKLAQIMTDNGYVYFDWTFDSGDTNKKDNSKEAIINNFKKNLKGDGEYVVLMHDIKKNTLEALPEIIEITKKYGYKFSKLDENSPTEHLKIVN